MATYSLYDATIIPAKAALTSLRRILSAGEQHRVAEPARLLLLSARLHDDMRPLTFQVHYATAQADKMVAKLSGREPSAALGEERDLASFADMYARIDQVLAALAHADKDTVNRIGETLTAAPIGHEVKDVPVKALATAAIMPNVYFHVSMAYAILRKEGVPVGKRDYLRSFVSDYVE